MNLLKLNKLIYSEEKAFQYLQKYGVLHRKRKCKKGHYMKIYFSKTRSPFYQCNMRSCRQYVAALNGTWFKHCKISLRKCLLFIYAWANGYSTTKFCKKELNISKKTITDWKNMLREICAMDILEKSMIIGGEGLNVEIDESCFSKRKYQKGRLYPNQWVFGGVCRENREVFLYAVPDRTAETLTECIKNSIRPGTTIYSDLWRSYNGLKKIPGMRYKHFTVNHSENFVDPKTGAHTQRIESLWASIKRRNKNECGTRRTLFDSYLCEFIYRRRYENRDIFECILESMRNYWPPQ